MEPENIEKNQRKDTSYQFVNSGFYCKEGNFYGLDIACDFLRKKPTKMKLCYLILYILEFQVLQFYYVKLHCQLYIVS